MTEQPVSLEVLIERVANLGREMGLGFARLEQQRKDDHQQRVEDHAENDARLKTLAEAIKSESMSLRTDLVGELKRMNGSVAQAVKDIGVHREWQLQHDYLDALLGGFDARKQLRERVLALEQNQKADTVRASVWRAQWLWLTAGVALGGSCLAIIDRLLNWGVF